MLNDVILSDRLVHNSYFHRTELPNGHYIHVTELTKHSYVKQNVFLSFALDALV